VTQRLMARSRRTPRVLALPMPLGAFQPPKPENRILLRYALDGHGYIFSCLPSLSGQNLCTRMDGAKEVELLVRGPNPGKTVTGPPRCGLRWLKSSERHGQDKRPRGPSTPRHQALCHAISLCRAPLRMTILWEFRKNIPTQV
jgi:hypothetical protein